MPSPLFLGLDFGTSGVRACVMAPHGEIEELARIDYSPPITEAAATWRDALFTVLAGLPSGLRKQLSALAIDGTSATVLACDVDLNPQFSPLMYNDARATAEAAHIAMQAGAEHPAAMPTSGLAKVLWLAQRPYNSGPLHFYNQADWLAALLTGQHVSDFHNAMKMGLDLSTGTWPVWLSPWFDQTKHRLPKPVRPGETVGLLSRERARQLGINTDCLVRAGTTDSIAAFLAAGVTKPGEAVTSLGTTLVLKLLSHQRVDAAQFGVYSHWFGNLWLTGGASNAGGGVLRQHFSPDELTTLSARIDPTWHSGLNYTPLPCPGERFPINNPNLPPKLEPVPESRTEFLHGMLEGLANIERAGYQKLVELGATPLSRVVSMGGGAQNTAYSQIRARELGVPVTQAAQPEACYGTARLACLGTSLFPGASAT